MKIKISTWLVVLFFVTLQASPSRATEIRQEQFVYHMELTKSIPGNVFIMGEFPAIAPLAPPIVVPVRKRIQAILAVRAGSSSPATDASSVSDDSAKCIIPPVLFALNSSEISEQTGDALLALLAKCNSREIPLVVTGYTCSLGSRKSNDLLARQRAEAVARLLQQKGFTVAEVRSRGRSGYRTTAADQQHLNRRVEITPLSQTRHLQQMQGRGMDELKRTESSLDESSQK